MVLDLFRLRAWPERLAPACVRNVCPPPARVIQWEGPRRSLEDKRSRDQELHRCSWVVGGVEWSLGNGLVAGLRHKALELGVRDRVAIDPEAIDANAMDRRLLRIEVVRAHQEIASRNPLHVLARWLVLRRRGLRLRGHILDGADDSSVLVVPSPSYGADRTGKDVATAEGPAFQRHRALPSPRRSSRASVSWQFPVRTRLSSVDR